MNISFVLSECNRFYSKSEISFDIRNLAKSLVEAGNTVNIYIPYYKVLKDQELAEFVGKTVCKIGEEEKYVGIHQKECDGINYLFVDNNEYFGFFDREGYSNDGARYIYYNEAILESFRLLDNYPDIIHIVDWYGGLIPYILKSKYKYRDEYRKIKTVLTVFDFRSQGIFENELQEIIHAPNSTILEFDNKLNFLKAGLLEADYITTTSNTYLQTSLKFNKNRLAGILADRLDECKTTLFGVRDGLSPEASPYIYNYTKRNFAKGKATNKDKFRTELGLPLNNVMFISYVGAFTESFGFDIFSKTLESLLNETDIQFFFLGYGDKKYEDYINYLTVKYSDRFRCYIGYTDELRDKALAASDMILEPSAIPSASLATLSGMKFGCLPLVYEKGANKDIVEPYNKYTDEGNGYSFSKYTPLDFKKVLDLAYGDYRFNRKNWDNLCKRAMSIKISSKANAIEYMELYKEIKK